MGPLPLLPREILAAQWPWLAVIPVAGNRFLLHSMGRFITQPTPDNRGHFIQEEKADPESMELSLASISTFILLKFNVRKNANFHLFWISYYKYYHLGYNGCAKS